MDFLCLYQHALPCESDALSAVMTKRKQLWNKVDGLLRSLPLRSLVVLAGDFNSSLCTSAPCIGHSVLHNKVKPVVADERQWLTGMLVSHQLAALNSWSRRLHTYTAIHREFRRSTGFLFVLLLRTRLLGNARLRRLRLRDGVPLATAFFGHRFP